MKTKTTKKGETTTPIEETPRMKCYKKLNELNRIDLAELTTTIIELLFLQRGDETYEYAVGWNDARRSIIYLCNLSQYWSHE